MQSAAVDPVRLALRFLGSLLLTALLLAASAPPGEAGGQEGLQRAAQLVQQGRLDEADREAQRALADPDTRAVAFSVLGTIRLQQQQFNESARLLQEALRLEPRLIGANLTLAQVYILQNRPTLALPLYARVLELDPSNATARLALARAAAEQGKTTRSQELAAPLLGALKEVGADASFELAFNLGGVYLLNKDPARALEAYDVALRVQPASLPALLQAAALAEREGEFERSLSYWMRAKKIAPEQADVLLGFGRVCLRMDLLDDAEAPLTKAAALKPDEPAYQYTLAAAKVGKRQFEAAQALLEPLVAKHPEDAQLQYALGSVLYIQGRLPEAATHLRESARLQPKQLASHYYLALVVRDQGQDAEAITMLEALLQRYPDHAGSCEALGGLLMTAQRYPDAERYLRKAIQANPKSVKANYQLGLLLARTGRKDEADTQLALSKTLRQEDEATSRLQLRLLEQVP